MLLPPRGDKNFNANISLKHPYRSASRAPTAALRAAPPPFTGEDCTSTIVLAMHRHPSLVLHVTKNAKPVLYAALEWKGGGAPEGAYAEAASADAAAPSESSASSLTEDTEGARLSALHRGACPAN